MKAQTAAAYVMLSLLSIITVCSLIAVLTAPAQAEYAKNILLLISGITAGVISSLFSESKERFIFEQPSSYKAEVSIKSVEQNTPQKRESITEE
ncbi:MAG: hypothetical protein DRH44_04525 [Candidatus Coatesbacteria bacterium]|nr:MAG: hypothetical protein DRH49_02725 [Candidatus Coatesbacteria bacterium]RLC43663.1 MAG: hypothetical protein DRH44_04525 [Candidatus Coatesbacteria bacterium]